MKLDGQTDENFDDEEIGIRYSRVSNEQASKETEQQESFDTRQFGKSNRGHTFPEALTHDEKLQVLEYLKTL